MKTKKKARPEELLEKYGKAKVSYEHDGNFTIALVKHHRKLVVGVAKKSPVDPQVDERGEQIALIRALRKLG